jgi:hypothetical protein
LRKCGLSIEWYPTRLRRDLDVLSRVGAEEGQEQSDLPGQWDLVRAQERAWSRELRLLREADVKTWCWTA